MRSPNLTCFADPAMDLPDFPVKFGILINLGLEDGIGVNSWDGIKATALISGNDLED